MNKNENVNVLDDKQEFMKELEGLLSRYASKLSYGDFIGLLSTQCAFLQSDLSFAVLQNDIGQATKKEGE